MSVARFQVVVLYENEGHHLAYANAAKPWLDRLARDSCFVIKYLTHAGEINDSLLNRCDLFIQLDYPPFGWTPQAAHAFERYMKKGRGGWIGFHHASLVGTFDGYPVWPWFCNFMGGIHFKNYIAGFADGMVQVEDSVNGTRMIIPREALFTCLLP